MRWLLDASENHEALQVIEAAAYRRPVVLPEARRYRFAADFAVMIGYDNLTFKRGQIISLDGHGPKLIQQVFERGGKLEAVE
jgi:hypothetical protein